MPGLTKAQDMKMTEMQELNLLILKTPDLKFKDSKMTKPKICSVLNVFTINDMEIHVINAICISSTDKFTE